MSFEHDRGGDEEGGGWGYGWGLVGPPCKAKAEIKGHGAPLDTEVGGLALLPVAST